MGAYVVKTVKTLSQYSENLMPASILEIRSSLERVDSAIMLCGVGLSNLNANNHPSAGVQIGEIILFRQ